MQRQYFNATQLRRTEQGGGDKAEGKILNKIGYEGNGMMKDGRKVYRREGKGKGNKKKTDNGAEKRTMKRGRIN